MKSSTQQKVMCALLVAIAFLSLLALVGLNSLAAGVSASICYSVIAVISIRFAVSTFNVNKKARELLDLIVKYPPARSRASLEYQDEFIKITGANFIKGQTATATGSISYMIWVVGIFSIVSMFVSVMMGFVWMSLLSSVTFIAANLGWWFAGDVLALSLSYKDFIDAVNEHDERLKAERKAKPAPRKSRRNNT